MHFTLDISLGQVITILSVALAMWRMDRIMVKLMYEHDLMMIDYYERKGIKVDTFPARVRR